MALLPILEYPDPRLRKVAAPVTSFAGTVMLAAGVVVHRWFSKRKREENAAR